MFLTKREALTLAKLLAIHNQSILSAGTSDFQREVEALNARVEAFLVGETEPKYDDEEIDEEAEDDVKAEEDPASEEDEEDKEATAEGEEPPEEDDAEALHAYNYVAREDLFYIRLKTSQGQLTFKDDDGDVNLCIDDVVEMQNVTHMKRFGKELHVRDSDGEWEVYDVKKFSPAWLEFFPLAELVEVE